MYFKLRRDYELLKILYEKQVIIIKYLIIYMKN